MPKKVKVPKKVNLQQVAMSIAKVTNFKIKARTNVLEEGPTSVEFTKLFRVRNRLEKSLKQDLDKTFSPSTPLSKDSVVPWKPVGSDNEKKMSVNEVHNDLILRKNLTKHCGLHPVFGIRNSKSRENLEQLESDARKGVKLSIGNCGERSALAFNLFLECPSENDWYGKRLERVHLGNNGIRDGDHAFVVIGRDKKSNINDMQTWGKDAIVCDPWGGVVFMASNPIDEKGIECPMYGYISQYPIIQDVDSYLGAGHSEYFNKKIADGRREPFSQGQNFWCSSSNVKNDASDDVEPSTQVVSSIQP